MQEFAMIKTPVQLNALNCLLNYGLRAFDIFGQALHQWLENNPNNFARIQIEDLLKHYLGWEREKFIDLHAEAIKRSVFTQGTNSVITSTPNLTKKAMSLSTGQVLKTSNDTKLADFQSIRSRSENERKQSSQGTTLTSDSASSWNKNVPNVTQASKFYYPIKLGTESNSKCAHESNLICCDSVTANGTGGFNKFKSPPEQSQNVGFESDILDWKGDQDLLHEFDPLSSHCNTDAKISIGESIPGRNPDETFVWQEDEPLASTSSRHSASTKYTKPTREVRFDDNLATELKIDKLHIDTKETLLCKSTQVNPDVYTLPRGNFVEKQPNPVLKQVNNESDSSRLYQHTRRYVPERVEYAPPRKYEHASNPTSYWTDSKPFVPRNGTMRQQPSRHEQFSYNCVPPQGRQEYTEQDAHHMAVALERTLLDESSRGFRFAGNHNSEYPAFRHRFLLRYQQFQATRPDLLLRWIEATIEGQAKKYIRNAYAVMDAGKACDVVWETLEEVYGRMDVIVEDALNSLRRPMKSIDHNRKSLLELRADMRNVQGILQSLNQDEALEKSKVIGDLYNALSEKLRGRLEAFLPPDRWSFNSFLNFLTGEIAYVDSMRALKIVEKESYPVRKIFKPIGCTPIEKSKRLVQPLASSIGQENLAQSKNQIITEKGTCCLHPKSTTHALAACKLFQDMSTTERWQIARTHNLCFKCLESNHRTKYCKSDAICNKCNRIHHALLHEDIASKQEKDTNLASTKSVKAPVSGKVNSVGLVKTKDHSKEKERIAIMILTVVGKDHEHCIKSRNRIYAAIDTGATSTLCSRDLAETLLERWEPDGEKEYKLFNGSKMKCSFMKHAVELERSEGETTTLGSVTFIDHVLPFEDYL